MFRSWPALCSFYGFIPPDDFLELTVSDIADLIEYAKRNEETANG